MGESFAEARHGQCLEWAQFPWSVLPRVTQELRGEQVSKAGVTQPRHLCITAEPEGYSSTRHIFPARVETPELGHMRAASMLPWERVPLVLPPLGREHASATERRATEDPEPPRQPCHHGKVQAPLHKLWLPVPPPPSHRPPTHPT